jgi:NAD(P)-dependent dehydrogenase (short-subunit alcohol dehydrogenase family)
VSAPAPRVAVVTGANRGIGRAIAARLAAGGDRLVLVARDAERTAEVVAELGDGCGAELGAERVVAVDGDVSDPATGEAAVAAALARWDRLDVLVNNAALDLAAPLLQTTPAQARQVAEVNLLGSLFMLQACARAMRDRGGGAIVNLSSRLAVIGVPTMAVYGAMKGGIEALTRGAAIELAPHGVRVNAVAPGFTETPLFTEWLADQDEPERARAEVADQIPQRRLGTVDDVAAAVAFLAGAEAGHITGTVLRVDGGYTAQ